MNSDVIIEANRSVWDIFTSVEKSWSDHMRMYRHTEASFKEAYEWTKLHILSRFYDSEPVVKVIFKDKSSCFIETEGDLVFAVIKAS
jgi:hypothetical protein